MLFCVRLLSGLMILLFNSSCDKQSDLSQQFEEAYELLIDLRNIEIHYQKYQKMLFCIQLHTDIWEIILYLQANPNRLKTKNINSLIFVSTIVK